MLIQGLGLGLGLTRCTACRCAAHAARSSACKRWLHQMESSTHSLACSALLAPPFPGPQDEQQSQQHSQAVLPQQQHHQHRRVPVLPGSDRAVLQPTITSTARPRSSTRWSPTITAAAAVPSSSPHVMHDDAPPTPAHAASAASPRGLDHGGGRARSALPRHGPRSLPPGALTPSSAATTESPAQGGGQPPPQDLILAFEPGWQRVKVKAFNPSLNLTRHGDISSGSAGAGKGRKGALGAGKGAGEASSEGAGGGAKLSAAAVAAAAAADRPPQSMLSQLKGVMQQVCGNFSSVGTPRRGQGPATGPRTRACATANASLPSQAPA